MKATCSEPLCGREVRSREMCGSHYETWRKSNRDKVGRAPVKARWDNPDGTRMACMRPGCEKPIDTQGMCKQHYQNMHYESTRGATKLRKNRKLTDYDGNKSERFCTFEGCGKVEFNPGLCAGHYTQKLRGLPMTPLNGTTPCPVPRCHDVFYTLKTRTGMCKRHSALSSKYSIPKSRLIELFTDPKCGNPGCDETEKLYVDHDHSCCERDGSCGECVRGLLCRSCNTALGLVKDSPNRLLGLLKYLEGPR